MSPTKQTGELLPSCVALKSLTWHVPLSCSRVLEYQSVYFPHSVFGRAATEKKAEGQKLLNTLRCARAAEEHNCEDFDKQKVLCASLILKDRVYITYFLGFRTSRSS